MNGDTDTIPRKLTQQGFSSYSVEQQSSDKVGNRRYRHIRRSENQRNSACETEILVEGDDVY